MEFPVLYCLDKSNKERMWKIWVDENIIYKTSGLTNGKKVTHKRVYAPKNVGKTNETTSNDTKILSPSTVCCLMNCSKVPLSS